MKPTPANNKLCIASGVCSRIARPIGWKSIYHNRIRCAQCYSVQHSSIHNFSEYFVHIIVGYIVYSECAWGIALGSKVILLTKSVRVQCIDTSLFIVREYTLKIIPKMAPTPRWFSPGPFCHDAMEFAGVLCMYSRYSFDVTLVNIAILFRS